MEGCLHFIVVLIVTGVTGTCQRLQSTSPPYSEKYFSQDVDHFNYLSFRQNKFMQRYLVQDKWWKPGSGPIFFYTGNELPITYFWENAGFLFDIAPRFQALILFMEHRFYGTSLPFGNQSFTTPNIGLLTVEQAIADYAVFLTYFKKNHNASQCHVITFGGSYGGRLSAYMRFKYPDLVQGSIAASAPIYLVLSDIDRRFFFQDVTAFTNLFLKYIYDGYVIGLAVVGGSYWRNIHNQYKYMFLPFKKDVISFKSNKPIVI